MIMCLCSGLYCLAAEIAFDKEDICNRIRKHGGCLLENFDLAAVRLLNLFVALRDHYNCALQGSTARLYVFYE